MDGLDVEEIQLANLENAFTLGRNITERSMSVPLIR